VLQAWDGAPPMTISVFVEVDEADLRRFAGMRPSVSLLGTGTLAHRLWGRPAVAVLGIEAPPITEAANKLVPAARAKVSVRLAPGDGVAEAKAAIQEHFNRPALPGEPR
jgi:Peptidase dimerisation domain